MDYKYSKCMMMTEEWWGGDEYEIARLASMARFAACCAKKAGCGCAKDSEYSELVDERMDKLADKGEGAHGTINGPVLGDVERNMAILLSQGFVIGEHPNHPYCPPSCVNGM